MATRTRETIPPREREKRRTSPSQLPQQQPSRRPHPSSTSKVTSSGQTIESSASNTQISSHLKSTKTPLAYVSKQQAKKPTPGGSAHKPTFRKRSTFAEQSSPSTMQKTEVFSPNDPTSRPSSFSNRTTSMQKTGPARKQSSLSVRPFYNSVKKRFIYVKKQDIRTNTANTTEQDTSPPETFEVSNAYNVQQPEPDPKDQESPMNEADEEEAIQIESNNQAKADVLVQEDPEPISNEQAHAENEKDANLKICGSSTVSTQQDTTLDAQTDDREEKSEMQEPVRDDHEVSVTHDINEIISSKTDEIVRDNPISEVEEMNKGQSMTVCDKNEEGETESEVRDLNETKVQEVKRNKEKATAKKQVPMGKKESVVSNDVIEETVSKLREQSINKVKALAGAFETVISLQEQK